MQSSLFSDYSIDNQNQVAAHVICKLIEILLSGNHITCSVLLLCVGKKRKKDILTRARQSELEKSCSAHLEEGQTRGGSATSEAAALRRTARREKEDTPVRAR